MNLKDKYNKMKDSYLNCIVKHSNKQLIRWKGDNKCSKIIIKFRMKTECMLKKMQKSKKVKMN